MANAKRSTILIGTTNAGKVRELSELFSALPIDLVGLSDVGISVDIDESGSTFAENASLKASEYAKMSRMVTLADDSGLEVQALGNRPGVMSARYGGEESTFAEKIELLLGELGETGSDDRTARFVCSMALADPDGHIMFRGDGICEGNLALRPRGTAGFGYDPIFIPKGFDRTFGELDIYIKQQISHRSRAAAKIMRYLQGFLNV